MNEDISVALDLIAFYTNAFMLHVFVLLLVSPDSL